MLQFTLNLIVIPERSYYNTFNLSSYVLFTLYNHNVFNTQVYLYIFGIFFHVYTILYILEFRHIGKHLRDLPSRQTRERLLCRLENNLC
jgi:hypothetical protein